MNHQHPTDHLAAFKLPIEEFDNRTPYNADSCTNLPTISMEDRRTRTTWRWKETLGRGSCGCVRLQERGADLRAVKMMRLSRLRKNGIVDLNEISAMARLSRFKHNDRAVFGEFYGYSMNNKSLFLAMEYFPLRDLKGQIEATIVDEEEAKKIVYDLLVGLKIMHAEGIVHRDLKPENIFVAGKPPESRWSVKIADFGISKHIPPEGKWDLTLWCGTRYYIAPELQGLMNPCQENPGAMDMWSLGIIVYFLATKQYPFGPRELVQFCHNDKKFPFQRQPMLKRWSSGSLAFVEALLRPLPRDRLSAEGALRHSWITSMSEEPARFSMALTTSESILSAASPQEIDRGLVSGDQHAVSEHSKALASVAPRHPQTPPSIQSTSLWLEQSQTTSYPHLIIPHWLDSPLGPLNASHPRRAFTPSFNGMIASYVGQTYRVASPGPLPPLWVNPPPTSFANETPPVGGWQNCLSHFTPPNSPPAQSEPRMPLQKLERRATAPAPSRLIEDAIDLISPRTERTEAPGPVWEDRFAQEEASDSTSSSIEMSLTDPLNSPSPAPPSTTSLVWRDPRLMRLSRSMSDSFVQSSYASSSTDREWRRASAVEFVNDPRFHDSVHALYHAIVSGRDEVVELLLDAGVDIETVFRDPLELQKGTALHLAITRGRIDVAEVLLRRGACLTAKAEAKLHFQMKSLEPLHLAAFYGFEKIACMLLARGARIEANATGNFRDRKRRTPLHLAVLGEDPDEVPRMVRLLLQHGADPHVKDTLGMRPGDYAVMVGRKSLTADLPASSFKTIKAKATKVRSKLEPLALAAPLLFGVGVAMILK